MADRVLLDVTPLGSGHGSRGIGTYIQGFFQVFVNLSAIVARNFSPTVGNHS